MLMQHFLYANSTGSTINFDPSNGCATGGTVGCFSFSSVSNNMNITSGTANGLSGAINGSFGVGAISTAGGVETAAVTSTNGMLTINDSGNTFTADLEWVDTLTVAIIGGLNLSGAANLSNIAYSGSNGDLVALAAGGIQTLSFQFASLTSLTELFETNSSVTSTSFSGSIQAVPLPAAAWLFGSALLGFVGISRRNKS